MDTFVASAQQWANTILLWIGFGTVVGLVAQAVMPGRDQASALATLLMGVGGAIVGLGTLAYFWEGHRVTPVSFLGFVAATGGAFLILFFHRLLQGSVLKPAKEAPSPAVVPHRRQHAEALVRQK